MVELAVSTQLFGAQTLAESHFAMIRDSGFRIVEVFAAPGHFEWQDRVVVESVAGWLHKAGLGVCSLHAPWAPGQDIANLDPALRELSTRSVERAVDALVALEGRLLVLHPGANPGPSARLEEQLDYAREGIRRVASYCAARGVRAALENPPPYELAGDNRQTLGLYRDLAAQPAVQACFDTGHAHVSPEGVAAVRQVPLELALVHISDNTGAADDHQPPGQGTIDWAAFFAMLEAREFDGCLVLELTDLPDPAQVLAEGWAWMNQMTKDMR